MTDLSAFTIPLPDGRRVVIEGDFPLAETEWEQFVTVLEAMKPGLIQGPAPKGQDPEE